MPRSDKPTGSQQIDVTDVVRLAANHLARYAASSMRLRRVLERQIRRWHDRRDLPQPETVATAEMIDTAIARMVDLGFLDDAAVTLARARGLVRKGLPGGQVRLRLAAEGLDNRAAALEDVIVEDAPTQARRYAARKRLGPFRTGAREANRDKDIRSLMRAGFAYRDAVATVDGTTDEIA